MKLKLATTVLLSLSLVFASQATLFAAISSGSSAPDFSLTDTNGNSHSLSDYEGKYVVLEWTNPDCPFVVKHYGSNNMQSLQEKYAGGKDVIWLSVASSAPGKQGHYTSEQWNDILKEKAATPTALLLDPDGKVGKLYGAKTTPHMYVIDPEGTLIYQGAIDDRPSANPADVVDANNYVQSVLDAAFAGEEVAVSSTKSYGCSVKY